MKVNSAKNSTAVTVGSLAIAAIALWAASRMVWVSFTSADGLGEARVVELDGSTWAAALTPLALTLVAAIAASFAVKGWLLKVLGVLVALVAVAAAVPVVQLVSASTSESETASRAAQLAELPARAEARDVQVSFGPAALAAFGVLAALIAAVALLRRPTRSAGLSSKYDAPAARREAARRRGESDDAEPTQRVMWDALDAGDDPTDDPRDEDPGTRT